jgi:pimeloyl-ACP methyl ester carboxylesterase
MKFQKYNFHNKFRNTTSSLAPQKGMKPISDKEGLDTAYGLPNKLFINGDTLYVAGTSSLQDVWDDLKIPFHLTSRSKRYNDAEGVLKKNQNISTLVGHSLGSAVSLELQQNHPERGFKSRTYSVPTVSFSGGDRWKEYFDPISMFDFGAHATMPSSLNPHSFARIASDKGI